MKRFFTIFFLCIIFFVLIFAGREDDNKYYKEYLRIHIRANSNFTCDQDVKYQIKDSVVDFLTPIISSCETKKDFEKKLKENLINIECISNNILAQNSFDYKSHARIDNEYFPTRSYDSLTLENGYYDALIIDLGDAKGDNWWCVVYPPLCFLSSNSNYIYKSRIAEIIKKYFGG